MLHDSLGTQIAGFLGTSCANPAGPDEDEPITTKPERRRKPKPSAAKAAKKSKPVAAKAVTPAPAQSEASVIVEPAPARKERKRPSPKADAVPTKPAVIEPIADAPGKKPPMDILLLCRQGVRYGDAVVDLAVAARLNEESGMRFIRVRFNLTTKKRAFWEIRILPVKAERGPGWVSCFHDGNSSSAVHIYDLSKATQSA